MKAALLSFSFTALILKIAGLLLILGVLSDYIVLLIPPDFLNPQWLTSLVAEWVGRGTLPLLGIALILFGIWIERDEQPAANRNSGQSWLSGALVLSAILGLLFLLMSPLYFRNSQLASAAETRQINEQAASAEQQLNNELALRRNQVSAILSNQDLVDRLQEQLQDTSSLSTEEQTFLQGIQDTLEEVKNDPKALDQRVEQARQEGLSKIQTEQQKAIADLTVEMRRSRIQITLNSLLLAIGYLFITWNGMSLTGSAKPKRSAKTKKKK